MDKLCTPPARLKEGKGPPAKIFKLEKTDFLGQGKDKGGKADYQGCSEFNPILLLSERDEQKFKAPELEPDRNKENATNRRVVVFLFRPGSHVSTAKWPCPRAAEGVAGCKKRFWSDGEKRRTERLPDERRTFQKGEDTFACRFYHRMSQGSPCERVRNSFEIRLYNPMGRAIPFAPCEIAIGARTPVADTADARGIVTLHDVAVPATCHVKWGYKPDDGREPELVFGVDLFLKADDLLESESEEESLKKLNNLGYDRPSRSENIRGFQLEYRTLASPPLQITGELDDRTIKVLREVYRQRVDDLRTTPVSR
jgi:hypothetical protein